MPGASNMPVRVAIVGAGPAGLFLAKSLARKTRNFEIQVFEQNPANATYGFGVGLLGRSLKFLHETDPELHDQILDVSEASDKMAIVHRGQRISVTLEESVAIERLRLLNLLQEQCVALDVPMSFEEKITPDRIEELRKTFDIVVGADGVNSVVRTQYIDQFGSTITPQNNKFAWYATTCDFEGQNLIFEETELGLMIAHAYRYLDTRSGFVIECAPDVFDRAGFDNMSDAETRNKCEQIFSEYLGSHKLLAGNLTWFTPNIVRTPNWYFENVVLIGDALRTVHPSIGSGTRVGMRDADVLAETLDECGYDINCAFALYKKRRQASSDLFQRAAVQSINWYESVEDKLHLDPLTFAFSYMTRTGVIDYDRLRATDPGFIREYEATPVQFAKDI